jgi:hypothetical protein
MAKGIDDDYKLALGNLVMEVSRLESKLTDLIVALTDIHILPAIILVHQQQLSNKLDAVRNLFRLIYEDENDPEYQPVKETLDQVKEVIEFRNSVVHALWQFDKTGTPLAVRLRARKGKLISRQPAPIEKVREYAANDAVNLGGKLVSLAKDYRAQLSQKEED